jgi:hypothetical protein
LRDLKIQIVFSEVSRRGGQLVCPSNFAYDYTPKTKRIFKAFNVLEFNSAIKGMEGCVV